jgi:hypothetical protein
VPQPSAPPEVRLALTRVCLRHGASLLPHRARGVLPDGAFEAYDPEGQRTYTLELAGGRLQGLEPFLKDHDLAVNDELALRPRPDGHVVLLARPRARSAARDGRAVRRAVQGLVDGGPPRTLEELRNDHGLAADAPLETALTREPLLERRGGRWGLIGGHREAVDGRFGVGTAVDAPDPGRVDAGASSLAASHDTQDAPDAYDASAPSDGASPESMSRARDAFMALGYQVAAGRGGTLQLTANLGRVRQTVLARVLDEGDRPDWNALLQAVRAEPADHLALVGDVRDLTRLERPARGARATLWSWDGLERARTLAETVPIGPLDLAPAFEDVGLHGVGIERFEARIDARLQEQAAFSAVAERLAALRAPAVFTVDDLRSDERLPRETIVAELERMAGPPLQWTERRGPGTFALRQDIRQALERLAAFARSLAPNLPDPTRPRVRGDESASDAPDLLGIEELRDGAAEEAGQETDAEAEVPVGRAKRPAGAERSDRER